jgi:hypothetical protein
MPTRKRSRIEPTDDWTRLQLRLAWPAQLAYELIRPVVLFGSSPANAPAERGTRCRPAVTGWGPPRCAPHGVERSTPDRRRGVCGR